MSIDQLDSVENVALPTPLPNRKDKSAKLPDLADIPLHVRNMAALRGLGYSFRQIGEGYGVTPQAASIMLSRQKARMKTLRSNSEFGGLSPRAVNCLGRLGIQTREDARAQDNLETKLRHQRNCGQKTAQEIIDWAAA